MTGDVPVLEINRRTPVERVHLHYEGRSQSEVRSSGSGGSGSGAGGRDSTGDSTVDRSSSWVDIRRGFLADPDTVFRSVLESTPWAQGETWRYERYVAEQRVGAVIREADQQSAVRQTGMHLRSAYASRLSGVQVILYRDGTDFQALHSDRSMKWLDNTLIAVLVLGEPRPFLLRPRRPLSKGEREQRELAGTAGVEDVVLLPGRGDLIVMGGRCQRDWLHGVPACDAKSERISLIWRWTSRTGQPDTGPVYGEGVHYSDARSRPFRRSRVV